VGFESPFGLSMPGQREAGIIDWGSVIDTGFDIYDRWRARQRPPGPAMGPPQLPPGPMPQLPAPRWPGGAQVPGPYTSGPPYADLPAYSGGNGACPTMFRPAQATARAVRMIEARSPTTGKMHYWKHMGTPILFSGDLANCKRVGRVQARLNRARPRKR